MTNKKTTRPKGTKCVCGHYGGQEHSQHAGGIHGIGHGYGKCTVKRCRCRRFIAQVGRAADGD